MSEKNIQQSQTPAQPVKKRSWFRRLLRILFLLVLLVVGVGLTVRYWLVPAVLEEQLKSFLSSYWQGHIRVDDIDINLHGPIIFRGISASDPNEREWLRVESVELHLENWPGFSPVLTKIDINNPAIVAFVDKGELHLPFKWPARQPTTQPSLAEDCLFDIKKISLQNITLKVVESASPVRSKSNWKSALRQIPLIRLRGEAEAEGNIDIILGEQAHIDARFDARLILRDIIINDLRNFLGLPARKGETHQPLVLNRFQVQTISFRDGLLRVPDFYVETCDGKLWGKARAIIRPGEPLRYELDDLRAININLRKFYAAYDPTRHVEFGTAGAFLDIDGAGYDTRGMVVEGTVFMDNSDLDETRIIGDILQKLSVKKDKIENGSDLHALFRIKEHVLTLARARYGNNILAIDMIPYGTINLETGMMDFVVVSGFLKKMRKIPILGLAAGIGQGMSRLRVHGYWYEPREKIIHKEPLTDLANSTRNFFQDTLKTGGHITNIFANIVGPKPKKNSR